MTKRAILLDALASTPRDIARLARGLDETAAGWPAGGGWSFRDVVAHLVATEPLCLARLRRVAGDSEAAVATFLPSVTDQEPALPVTALSERFGELRGVTTKWLHELSPAAWQRHASHETQGRATLRFLVQDIVAHDIEHTAQLVTILGQWRAASRRLAGQTESGR